MQKRSPDEPTESEPETDYSLENCAQDIISAIHSRDAGMLADALKEAFQKLDAEPHEEDSKPAPHSYDAQNQLAGEE